MARVELSPSVITLSSVVLDCRSCYWPLHCTFLPFCSAGGVQLIAHKPLSRFNSRPDVIGIPMNLNLTIGPLVSLIAGILILIMPRLLNYIVAIYLIVIGLLGLFGAGAMHYR